MISGLVVSDRRLRPELHQTPEAAYQANAELIRFHGRGRLLYAWTPRFALSASEARLEVCQTLLQEHDGLHVETHLNEDPAEIAEVGRRFPWASDYFAVYERYGLCGPRSWHTTFIPPHPNWKGSPPAAPVSRIVRQATPPQAAGCLPCAQLLGGERALLARDRSRPGAGFGIHPGSLQAYLLKRFAPAGIALDAARLPYLATRAGAEASGLAPGDRRFSKRKDG